MRTFLLVSLVTMAGLAGCIQNDETQWDYQPTQWDYDPAPLNKTPAAIDPNSLAGTRFLALGDQGTGGDGQYRVAYAMEEVCKVRGCDFALALGDNIYEVGVTDEYDEQFETKFEQPYANFSIPFYMTQGNHDNSADPVTEAGLIPDLGIGHWYAAGNHEVAYHYREDRTSEKWQMPARYYDFEEGDGTFFSLDTNLLMWWGLGLTDELEDAPVPQEQEEWFDAAVASADTPWRVVFGHHPYLSNGEHGNAGDYEASTYGYERPDATIPRPDPLSGPYVEMFYEQHVCGKVDFIITGHDHDLQWLQETEECAGTEQIVSGAGGKTRSAGNMDRNPAHFQQFDTYGFLWVEMTDTAFTGVFYDVDGNVLFERMVTKDPTE